MPLFLQLLLNGLVNASIYSLLAVGFGLVFRSLRLLHIAFGAIYIIGSYTLYAGINSAGLPMMVSLFLGLVMAGGVGVLMDRSVYLPLQQAGGGGGVLLIASLGIYIFVLNFIALIFGNEVKILSEGVEPSFSFGSLLLTRIQILQFVIGWSIIVIFWIATRKNRFIKAMWAMGETPDLILVLGLPYKLMRFALFGISSLFAATASMLVTLDVGIDPHVGMSALLTGAVAVLVGGVNVFWGWVGGAVLLALLESIAVWQFSAKWNDLITFGMLIVVLLFRPQGLFSPKKRTEER